MFLSTLTCERVKSIFLIVNKTSEKRKKTLTSKNCCFLRRVSNNGKIHVENSKVQEEVVRVRRMSGESFSVSPKKAEKSEKDFQCSSTTPTLLNEVKIQSRLFRREIFSHS
jgi:phosphatidylserine decarboxylase